MYTHTRVCLKLLICIYVSIIYIFIYLSGGIRTEGVPAVIDIIIILLLAGF